MTTMPASDGSRFKDDVHRLGEGVGALKADVGVLAHGAADAMRSGVAELREGAHHAVDVAKERLAGSKDAALEAAESLKKVISHHPIASVGIAAGVGVLIGLVLSRHRS